MSRIASVFARESAGAPEAAQAGAAQAGAAQAGAAQAGAALIPYLTVGYPTVEATLEAVPLLEESGADIVELGIPFSDPMADGVTIQQASFAALQNGVTPRRCLEIAAMLRGRVRLPLVFMTYFNPVLSYGLEEFCADCGRAGVDGLIIPDLPLEEGGGLEGISLRHGVDLIYLLAPTSDEGRIRQVGSRSRGFVYLVSVTGVTGGRESLPAELPLVVQRVRQHTTLPLAVGFGISTPRQAVEVAAMADGVIVGSRIVQIMGSGGGWQGSLARFTRELKAAVAG